MGRANLLPFLQAECVDYCIIDDVPWKDEIIKDDIPIIKNGIYYLDENKSGWGVDIDEQVLKKYPSTNNLKSGIWSDAKNGI